MKTSEARAIQEKVTSGIHFPGGINSNWSGLVWDEESDWPSELMNRLTVLIGIETIEYASGYVRVADEVSGGIVVFTSRRLIKALFSVPRDPEHGRLTLKAELEATSRSTVQRVSSKSASPLTADADADWPKRAVFEVTTEDGQSFNLPFIDSFPSFEDRHVAAFASSLLDR